MDMSPERRREPRVPSQGSVSLRVLTPLPHLIEGELVDESASGMRVRLPGRMLETGTEIEFQAPHRQGRARVMWSRCGESGFEAGLYILPGD